MSDPISDAKNDAPGSDGKLKRKDYERELERLHVEFVKLQEWVEHKGLRVCIALRRARRGRQGRHDQGHDRAGQPTRVPGHGAAGTAEREKSQMYVAAVSSTPARRRRSRDL